ncbi:hypothetical protein [Parapedobacter sp. 2B3]|uniref:hypothetical protein n=1 Tax=Parapedobacter sp. 2B3 TaxID=3342381 RepID=UPI0035B6A1AF
MINSLKIRADRIDAYLRSNLANASQRIELEFAYFSANLHNLLPHVPRGDYLPLFNELQANRMLSDLDVRQAEAIDVTGWDDNWVDELRHNPGIVCTFHTGSYRFLSLLLARAGVPFSLVVAGQAVSDEREAFLNRYLPVADQLGFRPDVSFIDAGQAGVLIRMMREAKRGRCLLVYLDGNSGAGTGGVEAANTTTVPFCGGRLRARKGMAVLAYRLAIPIYPVLCQRAFPRLGPETSHRLSYGLLHAIRPFPGESESAFSNRATTVLYHMLGQLAGRSPHEWEGWLNIHRQLLLQEAAPIGDRLAVEEWAIYRWGKRAFLLHRPSYSSYEVSMADYRCFFDRLNEDFVSIHS